MRLLVATGGSLGRFAFTVFYGLSWRLSPQTALRRRPIRELDYVGVVVRKRALRPSLPICNSRVL